MSQENQWLRLAHPAFLEAKKVYFGEYLAAIEKNGWDAEPNLAVKKFEYLVALKQIAIPRNPSSDSFRQGNSIEPRYHHWRRAKFLQQYRLFFRYSSKVETIIYAWVNDNQTLRSYGSKTDAYLVFRKMLEEGRVPNDWDELIAESEKLS
ncbi:MAG: type II toxin-antitoxin system YhaV family toxin [Rhodoluna sp.]